MTIDTRPLSAPFPLPMALSACPPAVATSQSAISTALTAAPTAAADDGAFSRNATRSCAYGLDIWIRHLDYSSGLDIWIRHLDWTCGLDIWFRGQPPCEVKQEVAMPGVRCQGRETSPDDDANSIPFHLRLTFKVVCANKVNSFDWDFLTTRHAKDLCVCRVLYHCSLHQLVVVSL